MASKTISFVKGKGHISHNNRDFISSNVDRSRTEQNRYYIQESLEGAYRKCFGQALEEYNAKQKRKDRLKTDYISEIRNSGNGEKVFYENIVQIGDQYDTGLRGEEGANSPDVQKAVSVLEDYVRTFQERNPNLYLFNAALHMDEATPHLHLDYIPVATSYKTGLKTRNSLTKALQQMGMEKAISRTRNETVFWQERERAYLKELCRERGIEIYEKGDKRKSLTLPEYRAAMGEVEMLREQGAELTIVNTDLREEQDRLQEQIRIQETEKAEKEAEAQLLNQNAETLRQTIRETEQRLAAYENREKDLKLAEEALRKDKTDQPLAVPIENWGKETGFVKVKKADWQRMLRVYSNSRIREKTFEHYESKLSGMKKKLTSHRQTQEKTKEFLTFHGLAEKYDRFLANDGRISVRERLARNQTKIEQETDKEIVREKKPLRER